VTVVIEKVQEAVLVYDMKAYGGVETYLPLTLNLSARWRCGQIQVQATLLPGKRAPLPTE